MRLVCPRCGAQYEIDAAAIPAQGRDVECSSCDHVWRATRPFDPAARPALSRPLNDSVLDILRQEAARELEARAAERAAERATERTTAALVQFQRPRDGAADIAADTDGGRTQPAGQSPSPVIAPIVPANVAHGSQLAPAPTADDGPKDRPAVFGPEQVPVAPGTRLSQDDALPGGLVRDDLPPRRIAAEPAPAPQAARPDAPRQDVLPGGLAGTDIPSLHGGAEPAPGPDFPGLLDDPGSPAAPDAPPQLSPPRGPQAIAAATHYPAAQSAPRGRASARSRGRRRHDAGFHVAVMIALVAVALYALAPRLADQGQLGAQLMGWRDQVDAGRDWLGLRGDRLLRDATGTVRSLAD